MSAIAFDAEADALTSPAAAATVLGGLDRAIPILKHHDRSPLSQRFTDKRLTAEVLEKRKLRDGRVQMGTLGRGNHFVELQRDEGDRLWLRVHSGSRGMGQAIRDFHLKRATRTNTGLLALVRDSVEGAE